MANTLTNEMGKVLEMGIPVLRNTSALVRAVGRDYSSDVAKNVSDTINIPVQNDFSQTDVVAGYTHNDTGVNDQNPGNKQIVLNQWKKSFFVLTDKEINEINTGVLPRAAGAAIASLVNGVGEYLHTVASQGIGQSVGTPGTALFADISSMTDARQELFDSKVPLNGSEYMILGGTAENSALQLPTFHEADKSGSLEGLVRANLGHKMGFDVYGDQQVAVHTAGTITDNPTVTGINAVGAKTVNITCDAGDAIALLAGDLVTFGTSRTYCVAADISIGNAATGDVTITEGLEVATAATEALAVKASHTNNLAFSQECIQLVSAPLLDVGRGASIATITDPISGLSIMLEETRLSHQTIWTFSMLYGASVVREGFGVRLIA